jgi:hypothetical protein
MTTILSIQQIHCMQGSSAACKEVDNKGIGLVGDKETNGIVNGIEGFGEIEFPASNY